MHLFDVTEWKILRYMKKKFIERNIEVDEKAMCPQRQESDGWGQKPRDVCCHSVLKTAGDFPRDLE